LSNDEKDKLYLRCFASEAGAKVLQDLRKRTIEQPTWFPGDDASHGYYNEGRASVVREIEARIIRSRENNE
jgi:hypothetical protein